MCLFGSFTLNVHTNKFVNTVNDADNNAYNGMIEINHDATTTRKHIINKMRPTDNACLNITDKKQKLRNVIIL